MKFLMSEQPAIFVFKLRKNIAIEGDLLLAKMELDSFFIDKVQDLIDIKAIIQNVPELSEIGGFGELEAHVRQNGKQAYIANGLLNLLPHLIRRVSFIQRIYCVTQFSERAKAFLVDIVDKLGSIVTYRVVENSIIIQAVYPLSAPSFSIAVPRADHRRAWAVKLHFFKSAVLQLVTFIIR